MAEKKVPQIDSDELRRRAEERFGEKTVAAPPPGREEEQHRLNHELQVHRVELEMQNVELRQARDELETALEKYTDLYEFAPVGYVTLDRVGTVISVNLPGAGLVGVERSKLIGRRFGDFVTGEARPGFTAFLGKVFTGSGKVACEVTLLREGKALLLMIEGVAVASRQECRIALVDITERKLTEALLLEKEKDEAAKKSEELFRLFIDGVKDYAIFMLDVDGYVISWNEGAKRLKGWEAKEILGRHLSLFYTKEAAAGRQPELELEIAAAKGRYEEEGWRVRKDGSMFLADVIITAIRDESGKLRGFSKITRDITERKRAEEALRKVEEAAEEALLKLEEAADKARLKVAEAEKEPQQMAEAAKESRQVLEEEAKEARLKVAEEAESAEAFLQGEGTANEALEKVNKLAEVARLKVEAAAEVALQRAEKTAEALQKEKDASSILRQEKALAVAATRTKSQFLANMSHELRTPMTGVLGMLDLALSGQLEAQQREFISTAHTSALSMVRILNDILDLTKIEMGKFSLEVKPFCLRKCVEDTFNIFYPVAKNKGLDFNSTVADDVPQTPAGDQARLNQVLMSLAGNAIKFTKKGKVEISVSAGGSAPGGKRNFTFTVADTGIGIPDAKKHLLFHSFSQVDESHSRSYGGAGLGLAISKEIVERMGGTITFTSEEGVGSTFSFTVPLVEASSGSEAQPVAEPRPTEIISPAPEGARIRRLLLADDDTTIREFLGRMLSLASYHVDLAEDGQKAVEMWERGGYDLVLMDIQMPRLNGFEATRAIREKERELGFHTPIVAVTAHASKGDEQRCLDSGMDDFIPKPVNFEKALQMIEENINRSPAVSDER
jgi:PAS domain S-box-containing protein